MKHKNTLYHEILNSFFLSQEKKKELIHLLPNLSKEQRKRLKSIFQKEKNIIQEMLLRSFQETNGEKILQQIITKLAHTKKDFFQKKEENFQKTDSAFLKQLEKDLSSI